MQGSWEGNFLTLQRFMVRDLGLSGHALMAFAVVHGFAQATGSCTSPLSYFRFWTGCSKTTIIRAIDELEDAGLVLRGSRRTPEGRRGRAYTLTPRAMRAEGSSGEGDGSSGNAVVNIQGFMVTRLGLRGVDLITYAAIAGLAQLGGPARVPLSYLASWIGGSASTARRAVRRLEERGLVVRETLRDERGASYNTYALGPSALTLSDILSGQPGAGPRDVDPESRARTTEWDFRALRSHLVNDDYYTFGRDAYRRLRARGLSREDVERMVDEAASAWLSRHPDTEPNFAPRCQRVLETIEAGLERGGRPAARRPRRRADADRRRDPDELLAIALTRDTYGPLGMTAFELNDAACAARRAGDDRGLELARARIREWAEENRRRIETLVEVV